MKGTPVIVPEPIEQIVIVSDCTDLAYAEMRGAILRSARSIDSSANPRIEPLLPIADYSVLNAGFALRLIADAYGPNTLLMFVMNSLRERTERIIGRTETGGITFAGTNTGAVGWLLQDYGLSECFELHDPGFVPFGGKYVHAPAAGKALAGVPLSELGNPFSPSLVRRTLPTHGQVVHIDNFGNAKFPLEHAFEQGARLRVECEGWSTRAVYGRRMMEHEDGTWVVYPGSSMDLFEIGEVRGAGLRGTPVKIGSTMHIVQE